MNRNTGIPQNETPDPFSVNFQCNFSVGLAHGLHRPGDVTVDESLLLETIRKTVKGGTPMSKMMYNVSADWTDPGLHTAFDLLQTATGKRPMADAVYHFLKRPQDRFVVKVDRIPNDEELNQSRWLYLIVPKLKIADAKNSQSEPDGSYVIDRVTSKRKIAFGYASWNGWMMLFSDTLKELFLGTELTPIQFRPVKLKNGSVSGLWQIHSQWRCRLLP
jgi:hypothetical protein